MADDQLRAIERAALRGDSDAVALWRSERALRERLRRSPDCATCSATGLHRARGPGWESITPCHSCCGFGRTFGLRLGLAAYCEDAAALELVRAFDAPTVLEAQDVASDAEISGLLKLHDYLQGVDRTDDEPSDSDGGCLECSWALVHRLGCSRARTLQLLDGLCRPEWGSGPSWGSKAGALAAAEWGLRVWLRRRRGRRGQPDRHVNRRTERLVARGREWLADPTPERLEAWWAEWPTDKQVVRAGRLGPGPPARQDSDVPAAHDAVDDRDLMAVAFVWAQDRGEVDELRRTVLHEVAWAATRPGAEARDHEPVPDLRPVPFDPFDSRFEGGRG